jgi:4-aminobutyrate aminotransferase-like enzyme
LSKEKGIPFIVDETKTGLGASGKNWAHEYWYLSDD